MNPRKTIDEAGLKELAENIRKQGLIQPITVRPVYYDEVVDDELVSIPECYELVCGERRLKAVQLLNRKRIACYVKDMTDDEAFDAMITENLQRQDVDPIEEAFAFQQLNERGQSAEDIAVRFGKSVRFVQDRIKLNNLSEDLKKALREDRLPISGAMMLAKLNKEKQDDFFDECLDNGDSITKTDVVDWIEESFHYIDKALWDGDDCIDGYRACRDCEFNTSCQGCLFYEMKGERAKCTNSQCYDNKTIAYILWKVEHSPKPFLKDGESHPMEAIRNGSRRVLISQTSSYSEINKARELVTKVRELGYTILQGENVRRCWYDDDDERLKKLIDEKKVFEAVQICSYYEVHWEVLYYWYPEGQGAESGSSIVEDQTEPLINKYRRNEELVVEKRFDAFKGKMMDDKMYDREGELSDTERKAFAMLVYDALSFSLRRVICDSGSDNDFFKKMWSEGYDENKLFRLFIADKIK